MHLYLTLFNIALDQDFLIGGCKNRNGYLPDYFISYLLKYIIVCIRRMMERHFYDPGVLTKVEKITIIIIKTRAVSAIVKKFSY